MVEEETQLRVATKRQDEDGKKDVAGSCLDATPLEYGARLRHPVLAGANNNFPKGDNTISITFK